MLLFIASEVMFFAGLFAAYFSIRAGYTESWTGSRPTSGRRPAYEDLLNPFTLVTEDGQLNLILPATIILVLSSVTCQLGVSAIKRDDRRGFLRNFARDAASWASSSCCSRLYDYSVLIHEGLTMGSTTFGTTYFTLTGFHFAHVFGGVLMLGVVAVPWHGRPVPREAPRHGRGDVALLALRGRRLDPAVLDPLPAVARKGAPR